MAGYVLDLIEYMIRTGLLLFLCKDSILLREKYRSTGKVLFFMTVLLLGFWVSHSAWIDGLIYGNPANGVGSSSYSIIKLAIVFCGSFMIMDILYQERRMAKLYLILVFYTIQEMARFTWHSIWTLTITGYIDYLNERLLAETVEMEQFMKITEYLQIYAYLPFAVGYLSLMYVIIRLYRRYLTEPVEKLSNQGLWFLMLTPIIGMVFDVLWRVSLYYQDGTEIELLYEKHGSMYVVVPVIAVLCLVCTVFSRKIYSELMYSEKQKNDLMFYKQQLSDMTSHVRELEQLYDGIRGMRHDINNYVTDMEQLLSISTDQGKMAEQVMHDAGKYLQNVQRAADQLTLQFSTGNPVTDVILNRKGQICGQENIMLSGDLIYPTRLGIEAFDLGILLNNALDNAIEACRKIESDLRKEISFRGYTRGRMFFLELKNTCDISKIRIDGSELQTTKTDSWEHGLGISNMQSCVEKYYGTIQYETAADLFILTIMLQGRNAS